MHKRALVGLTVFVTLAGIVAVLRLTDRPVTGESFEPGTLRSAVLGEDRPFVVSLPESYAREPGRRYPVAYVLDGDEQLTQTAESAAKLARLGRVPELLVVGAPPLDGDGRKRDYTPPGMRQDVDEADSPEGRADRFLAFLEQELVPAIEARYRTSSTRLLAGNSRGGLFVVYSLVAAPDLFHARFAFSPALWRDGEAMVGELERFLAASPPLDGFLYLSLGDRENAKMTSAFERASRALRRSAPRTLRWHAEITSRGTHGDNARLSTPVALRRFFEGDHDPGTGG